MTIENLALSEVAEINPRIELHGLRDDTVVSFVPMSDVSESGQWVVRQERPLNQVRVGYTRFMEGDLLFAKITPCMENGKGAHAVGLQNGIGFGSTEFHVLRVRDGISPRFLHHWLQEKSTRTRAIAFMGGSAGQQRVQADFFSHFRIPHIDTDAQTRIAAVLDTVLEAIGKTEQVIAKLKQVRAGLLHDLLTRGLDEHGQLRDPLAHPEQFQDSPLGPIPCEWEPGCVSQFCELHNEFRLPIAGKERDQIGGVYPYYGPTGVLDHINEYRVEGKYVLIGEDGDHFLKFDTQPMTLLVEGRFNVNNHAHILCGRGKCTTEWIHTFFCQRNLKRYLLHQGAGRLKLNQSTLLTIPMVVPLKDEQRAIRDSLDQFDQRIEADRRELDKLVQLKSGLMTDLLTGRVPVPADLLGETAR